MQAAIVRVKRARTRAPPKGLRPAERLLDLLAAGVSKDARSRFEARIQTPDGRKINLGAWGSGAEAHACTMGAAAMLHGEFWVGLRDAAEVLEVGGLMVVK